MYNQETQLWDKGVITGFQQKSKKHVVQWAESKEGRAPDQTEVLLVKEWFQFLDKDGPACKPNPTSKEEGYLKGEHAVGRMVSLARLWPSLLHACRPI